MEIFFSCREIIVLSNEKKLGLEDVGNMKNSIFKKVCTWENNFENSHKKNLS